MEGDREAGRRVGGEKGEERVGGAGAEEESRKKDGGKRKKPLGTRVVLGGDRERKRQTERWRESQETERWRNRDTGRDH